MDERRSREGRRGRGGGISALPAIKSAIGLALSDLDYRPFLRATDDVERMVEGIVGNEVAERRARDRETERRNLATEVGNNVSKVVVPAISDALASLARAMRPQR